MTGLSSSCGACKFLRRKCTPDCVFTPYFSYNRAAEHFAAVHKVFGASNASKILLNLPVHERSEAAMSISYEALARMRDPVHGCVAQIFALQQQAASLQEEIDLLAHQMANGAFDADIYASFQGIDNTNNGLQPSFQCSNELSIGDYLSEKTPSITEYYLNQQTPPFKCTESTSVNQAFCTEMDNLMPPLYNWEDQVSHSCSDSAERLFMGTDQGFFLHYQLMENGSITIN